MNKEEKISVIVPVYNVELYLERCVNSIIGQTYKNIEIILVDDGSSDKSGSICDTLAKRDSRIVVAHKENGGAADARNFGLDMATGDLIAFVDADDYIDSKMYETLYHSLDDDASVVSCGTIIKDLYGNIQTINSPDFTTYFTGEQALENMLDIKNQIVGCAVYNKLYKAEVFAHLRFRKGVTGEDIEILYQLYTRCHKIVCIPNALYYYDKREGSVTTCAFSEQSLDVIDIAQDIEKYVESNFLHLLSAAYIYELMWLLSVYKLWYYSGKRGMQYETKIRRRIVEVHRWLRRNSNMRQKMRYASMLFMTWAIELNCYNIVRTIIGRNDGQN